MPKLVKRVCGCGIEFSFQIEICPRCLAGVGIEMPEMTPRRLRCDWCRRSWEPGAEIYGPPKPPELTWDDLMEMHLEREREEWRGFESELEAVRRRRHREWIKRG